MGLSERVRRKQIRSTHVLPRAIIVCTTPAALDSSDLSQRTRKPRFSLFRFIDNSSCLSREIYLIFRACYRRPFVFSMFYSSIDPRSEDFPAEINLETKVSVDSRGNRSADNSGEDEAWAEKNL